MPLCAPLIFRGRSELVSRRALLLDRDGVLIPDTGYPSDPAAISLLPGAAEALVLARRAGYRLVLVSNQAGVARGYFDLDRLRQVHDRLIDLLSREAVEIDLSLYCPHHPTAGNGEWTVACNCRKPAPGMPFTAIRLLDLDPKLCWMIGDKPSDVEAGLAAGCHALLLEPEGQINDLEAAVRSILRQQAE